MIASAPSIPTDPTGRAAYASGRGLSPASSPNLSTVSTLSAVCTTETLEVLAERGIDSRIAVNRNAPDARWSIWRDEDLSRIVDAFIIVEDKSDEYSEAFRKFDEEGFGSDLDALAAAWLEECEMAGHGAEAAFAEACHHEGVTALGREGA